MAEEKPSARRRDASGRIASDDEAEAEDREDPDAAAGETAEHETAEHDGEHEPDERGARGGRDRDPDSNVQDISDITAPSIGPGSTVEREPVEVRLARHEQSEVDAMGQDKRRQV